MKFKSKVIIMTAVSFTVLLILPLIFSNLANADAVMGLMMILFFAVNPISSICVNAFIGKDIKRLWWFPISFALLFLLSYWLVLKEILLDLTIYAVIYLLTGALAMAVSWIVKRK